jgi:hypothetical protein
MSAAPGPSARQALKPCPQAGYDQVGKSHFCLDCRKQWYGDDVPCVEADCPFLAGEENDHG